ncbi:MAG: DinB family protein [Bacteroidota bacterium]
MLSDKLRTITDEAEDRLAALSPTEISTRPAPDRWSKKEILGHLIDSAYNNHQRFLRGATQDHLRFVGYDQEEWVRRNAYQERDAQEVIATFLVAQRHLAHVIDTLPPKVLDRTTSDHDFDRMAMRTVPAGSPASLGFLIEDYLFHLVHHLRQIFGEFTTDWYAGYQRSADQFRLG